MPALSSEMWSGRTLTPAAGTWSASRSWQVTGATDETDALNATPLVAGDDPIPRLNDGHPQNGTLKVKSLPVNRESPNLWVVRAEYEIPKGGEFIDDGNPLLRPPIISWRTGYIAVPVDRASVTQDNERVEKPIVNSAGDAYDPPHQRQVRVKFLTIRRNEPFYDWIKARKFENTVNSNNFVFGPLAILAGEVLCVSIEPTTDYIPTAPYIEIAYNFEIRADVRKVVGGNPVSVRPFQLHLKDQGRRAWFNDSQDGTTKLGELFYGSTNEAVQVSEDVPFDGTGKPINSALRVSIDGKRFFPPVANPNRLSPDFNPVLSTNEMKVLSWDDIREENFAGLGL